MSQVREKDVFKMFFCCNAAVLLCLFLFSSTVMAVDVPATLATITGLDGSTWERGGGTRRVLRGGCWHDPPDLCRCAARLSAEASEGEDYFGFRVALTPLA